MNGDTATAKRDAIDDIKGILKGLDPESRTAWSMAAVAMKALQSIGDHGNDVERLFALQQAFARVLREVADGQA